MQEDCMSRFRERLRLIRKENKLTQDELAEKIGVSKNAVWSWENRRRNVSAEAVIRIALLFEVSTDWLLGLSDEKEISQKTGKWFGTVCSACGESTSFYYDCDYCPWCGARMEIENE